VAYRGRGAVFAIVVAKHPFGGTGNNIFNPAAAGFAFVAVCWPKAVFSYPMVFDRISPLAPDVSVRLVGSPLHALQLGGVPTTDIMDMLLGNCPGPMGATNILVLMTCLIYLAVRKSASLRMALSFLAGAAIVAAVFVRAPLTPLYSVLYELMSGLALFGAVFLINDPVTSPRRKDAMVVYGFLTGAVFLLLRRWGRFEESLPFAILLMNALVWSIDIMCEHFAHALRRKSFEQDLREIL
jgi:electron transport complex protein RnfD